MTARGHRRGCGSEALGRIDVPSGLGVSASPRLYKARERDDGAIDGSGQGVFMGHRAERRPTCRWVQLAEGLSTDLSRVDRGKDIRPLVRAEVLDLEGEWNGGGAA